MNSEPNSCPQCGAAIPSEAPQGFCPACLLAGAAVPTEAGAVPTAATKPEPPTLAQLAAVFPQLEIIELIGRGGMGFVFKARQPKLDRFVALKILPRHLADDPRFAERFAREGRLLAKLNHPNIVTVHDFGTARASESPSPNSETRDPISHPPFYYLLMEFVDGVNLRQAMRASRFTPAQALAIVPAICEALQYAHDEGVLHRDIKPENILLDAKGRVKIADFGIGKLMERGSASRSTTGTEAALKPASTRPTDEAAAGHRPALPSLTGVSSALGTPQYMAPEQLDRPASVDHRADIYSLGVVFYELLTGELPVGKFAPPSAKTPLDERVDQIVLRALAKEREQRHQSAREMKTEVETVTRVAGEEGVAASGRSVGSLPGMSRGTALALGSAMFYTGLVVMVVFCSAIGIALDGSYLITISSALVIAIVLFLTRVLGYGSKEVTGIEAREVRNWVRAFAIIAAVMCLPVCGYGLFFFSVLLEELLLTQSGYHPSREEALIVPFAILGLVLLPWSSWKLFQVPKNRHEESKDLGGDHQDRQQSTEPQHDSPLLVPRQYLPLLNLVLLVALAYGTYQLLPKLVAALSLWLGTSADLIILLPYLGVCVWAFSWLWRNHEKLLSPFGIYAPESKSAGQEERPEMSATTLYWIARLGLLCLAGHFAATGLFLFRPLMLANFPSSHGERSLSVSFSLLVGGLITWWAFKTLTRRRESIPPTTPPRWLNPVGWYFILVGGLLLPVSLDHDGEHRLMAIIASILTGTACLSRKREWRIAALAVNWVALFQTVVAHKSLTGDLLPLFAMWLESPENLGAAGLALGNLAILLPAPAGIWLLLSKRVLPAFGIGPTRQPGDGHDRQQSTAQQPAHEFPTAGRDTAPRWALVSTGMLSIVLFFVLRKLLKADDLSALGVAIGYGVVFTLSIGALIDLGWCYMRRRAELVGNSSLMPTWLKTVAWILVGLGVLSLGLSLVNYLISPPNAPEIRITPAPLLALGGVALLTRSRGWRRLALVICLSILVINAGAILAVTFGLLLGAGKITPSPEQNWLGGLWGTVEGIAFIVALWVLLHPAVKELFGLHRGPGRGVLWRRPAVVLIVMLLIFPVLVGALLLAARLRMIDSKQVAADTNSPLGLTASATNNWTAQFPHGSLELVAIAPHPSQGRQWWRPDGSLMFDPDFETLGAFLAPDDQRQEFELVWRSHELPVGASIPQFKIAPSGGYVTGGVRSKTGEEMGDHQLIAVSLPRNVEAIQIDAGLASGAWKTVFEHTGTGLVSTALDEGGTAWNISLTQVSRNADNWTIRTVVHDVDLDQWELRLIAEDFGGDVSKPGKVHAAAGWFTAEFRDLDPRSVLTWKLQARAVTWVRFDDVRLPVMDPD